MYFIVVHNRKVTGPEGIEISENVLAATNEAVWCGFDLKNRKSIPIPRELLNRFEKMCKEHQKLQWNVPVCGSISVNKRANL